MKTRRQSLVIATMFMMACSGMTVSDKDQGGASGIGRIDAGIQSRSGGAPAVGLGGAMASDGYRDASAAVDLGSRDAGRDATPSLTLGTDATVFSWDATFVRLDGQVTKAGGATASSGGSMASGGVPGKGGSTSYGGSSSIGGATSSGGIAIKGGSTSSAGSTSSGGSATLDGSVVSSDALSGAMDTYPPNIQPDAGSVDRGSSDAGAGCTMRIRGVVPLSLDHLVAGMDRQIVLRAEVTHGNAVGQKWNWWGYVGNSELAASAGTVDPSSITFPITQEGRYTFSVADDTNQCRASISINVFPADVCPECGHGAIVQAAPPVSSGLPIQNHFFQLLGPSPFSQTRIVLGRGVGVRVAPSIGTNVKDSYVRILDAGGNTRADGVADQKLPFTTRLLAMSAKGETLKYHVLVVPLDGLDGGTIGATAPQLFPNLTPDGINAASFRLADGVAVTGKVLTADGNPLADARVVFSNQPPDSPITSPNFLFSSVGKSESQGSYRVQVQPGSYWPSVTPPTGIGYAEAVALSPLMIAEGTQVSFRWGSLGLTTAKLLIQDSKGTALLGARVRLSTATPREVGQFTLRSATGSESTQGGYGNVSVEAVTSSSGEVVFSNLPVDTDYAVLIMPSPLGPFATTTHAALAVSNGSLSKVLRTMDETAMKGLLRAPAGVTMTDWSRVTVSAYDKSPQDPESTRTTIVRPDGSFNLGVTAGRPYVLIAIPPADSPFARTFVGPGVLQATEFELVQRMATRMDWASEVMDETQKVQGGTAVQVYCEASWPLCVDATIPIAETTAAVDGSFRLGLPDPVSR